MPGEHQAQFFPLCLHSEADEGAYHLDRTFHSSIASDEAAVPGRPCAARPFTYPACAAGVA